MEVESAWWQFTVAADCGCVFVFQDEVCRDPSCVVAACLHG